MKDTETYEKYQSDVIVDLLQHYDVPYIAMNPGASFRGLHDSIINYGDNTPELLVCQHEETAVQIAHGYAKATGKPMGVHPAQPRGHAARADGGLLRLHRPRPDLHHGRHRADARGQAAPAYRLVAFGAHPRRGASQLHQVGLPALRDRGRSGELHARLVADGHRARRPGIHLLRRMASGREAGPVGRARHARPRDAEGAGPDGGGPRRADAHRRGGAEGEEPP